MLHHRGCACAHPLRGSALGRAAALQRVRGINLLTSLHRAAGVSTHALYARGAGSELNREVRVVKVEARRPEPQLLPARTGSPVPLPLAPPVRPAPAATLLIFSLYIITPRPALSWNDDARCRRSRALAERTARLRRPRLERHMLRRARARPGGPALRLVCGSAPTCGPGETRARGLRDPLPEGPQGVGRGPRSLRAVGRGGRGRRARSSGGVGREHTAGTRRAAPLAAPNCHPTCVSPPKLWRRAALLPSPSCCAN